MKPLFLLLLQVVCAVASGQEVADVPVDSATEALPWDVRMRRNLLLLSEEAEASYYTTGMCVWDLTDDTLLFAYNQHKVMRPASTQKIVTAVAALSLLGAGHEYRTRAYHTGYVSADSVLHGDIYVRGDFDPAYSYSDVKELVRSIRGLGIRGIDGRLLADVSMKDSLLYGNGWCWDDVPCDNMPYLSPLMLERGTVYPDWKSYSASTSFHPSIEFMRTVGRELRDLGADTLQCAFGTVCADSPVLFYTKARTIADLLPHMMKTSDNLYAESVFYHIAGINKGRWATWKDGARLIRNVLQKAGVDTQYVEVADGSGVSLYNYISPQALLQLLRFAYKDSSVYVPLYTSLPVAGVDGSLKKRMTSGKAMGNVRAKTGTVSGVSSLAGYVTASNGHLLAFSIINNGLMRVATGRAFQDRVCEVLVR